MNTDNSQGKEGAVRKSNGFLIYEMLIIIAMTTLLIMLFFDGQARLAKEQYNAIQSLDRLQSLLQSQEGYAARMESGTDMGTLFPLNKPVVIEKSVPISTDFISRMRGFYLTESIAVHAECKNAPAHLLPWIDVNPRESTHESFE